MIAWTDYLNLLVGLLAIINPIAIAPIFSGLTRGLGRDERMAIARRGVIASGIIMLVSYLLGSFLLTVLGINISAFQVAGGLLILGMGLSMARGEDLKYEPANPEDGLSSLPAAFGHLSDVSFGSGRISATWPRWRNDCHARQRAAIGRDRRQFYCVGCDGADSCFR